VKQETFSEQIGRLRSVYGDRNYPDERLRLFWLSFKNIDDQKFEEAVSTAIETMKVAPLKQDLWEIIKSARTDSGDTKRTIENGCEYCNGSGLTSYAEMRGAYEYTFSGRCRCDAFEKLGLSETINHAPAWVFDKKFCGIARNGKQVER